MTEFDISIPTSIKAIKLRQWQEYAKILDKNKGQEDSDFVKLKMLNIFCGLDMNKARDLQLSTFDSIIDHINSLFGNIPDRIHQFTLRGTDNVEVTFGLIPNLDKMSYGEFLDLEKYLFDDKELHRAMAVLYRPLITGKGKDRYLIHKYKGTDELAEVMKDTPIDAVLSSRVFFYRLAKKLSLYTMDSTLQQLQEKREKDLDKHSEENGELTNLSIRWHREMLADLIKLQNSEFTNV
jgi:hypothetical protein